MAGFAFEVYIRKLIQCLCTYLLEGVVLLGDDAGGCTLDGGVDAGTLPGCIRLGGT